MGATELAKALPTNRMAGGTPAICGQDFDELSRGAARGSGGFTLLELVLVLVLVGVVMAIAAPSLREFISGRKSADAAAQVLALSRYAGTQAAATGLPYRFNLDCAIQKYWLSVRKGAEFKPLGNDFGRQFSLPDGTTACWLPQQAAQAAQAVQASAQPTAPHDYIDFYPDGRIEAPTLKLSDALGQVFELGCRSETEPLALLQEKSP
jgi:prepilin-type N-terminal cleavage/methylation domain-containing protein